MYFLQRSHFCQLTPEASIIIRLAIITEREVYVVVVTKR